MSLMDRIKRRGAAPESATETVNRRHFDANAASYDEEFGLSVELARGRARLIAAHARVPVAYGHVLELGCGTGNLVVALLREGLARTCVGVDISAGMIEVARRKTEGIDGCEFHVGSALDLPFEDGTFDLCVGDAFLHHVLDAAACLAEVRRVLKPGGVATFCEPSLDGYAFFEFVIRTVMTAARTSDPQISNYLEALRFMREHEGDLAALEAFPLPDKHHFSAERMRSMALTAGYRDTSWTAGVDPSPRLWQDAIGGVLTALKPRPDVRDRIQEAAALIDSVLGDVARRQFFVHNQFFLYA